MDKLVFTALNSLQAQRFERQALTNELANLSTTGFKKSYETAIETIKVQGSGFDSRFFSRIVEVDVINLSPGAPMATGRPMDIMINGEGVLGVQAEDGGLAFTRRGDMKVTAEGLVTLGDNSLVLEASGSPLAAPPGSTLSFGPDGTVYAGDLTQQGQAPIQIGQLFLRDASDVDLVRRPDGLFTPISDGSSDTGDIPPNGKAVAITPGALEGSNASAMEAMVRMIDLSRSFETSIRIMRETKDLDQQGASMMRLA